MFCYHFSQVNKIYYVSKCQLKSANKQFSTIDNDYELSLGLDSCIDPCEDSLNIPLIEPKFVEINNIQNHVGMSGIGTSN